MPRDHDARWHDARWRPRGAGHPPPATDASWPERPVPRLVAACVAHLWQAAFLRAWEFNVFVDPPARRPGSKDGAT